MAQKGFLNYVPQVHTSNGVTNAANYYGSTATLGKSRKNLYSNNFTHPQSIYKISEGDIAELFYTGRAGISATGAVNSNPDFNAGSVQYSYGFIQGTVNETKFNGNESASSKDALKTRAEIHTHSISNADENTLATDDKSGKYTPNLTTNGLNFNGTKTGDESRTTGRSGGGFGSDRRITFGTVTNDTTDIHDSRLTVETENEDYTTARGESVNKDKGVLNINEIPKLGSFEKSVDLVYDTTVIQS